nr:unnamed protein product [Spirometra erinaceieuropaei]
MVVQAVEENASKDLPGHVQQGDASALAAEVAVSFPLIKMDDCGVLEILRHSPDGVLRIRGRPASSIGLCPSVDTIGSPRMRSRQLR